MEDKNPLRVWRKAHGLTQAQAALRVGVSMTTLALWERGAMQPGPDRWIDIARVTGQTADAARAAWSEWVSQMVAA